MLLSVMLFVFDNWTWHHSPCCLTWVLLNTAHGSVRWPPTTGRNRAFSVLSFIIPGTTVTMLKLFGGGEHPPCAGEMLLHRCRSTASDITIANLIQFPCLIERWGLLLRYSCTINSVCIVQFLILWLRKQFCSAKPRSKRQKLYTM